MFYHRAIRAAFKTRPPRSGDIFRIARRDDRSCDSAALRRACIASVRDVAFGLEEIDLIGP